MPVDKQVQFAVVFAQRHQINIPIGVDAVGAQHFTDKIIITAAGRQDADAATGQMGGGGNIGTGRQIVIQLLDNAAADYFCPQPLPKSRYKGR